MFLRHVLLYGIMALPRVCDKSAHIFPPEIQGQGQQQEDSAEQETSMHDLLEAILGAGALFRGFGVLLGIKYHDVNNIKLSLFTLYLFFFENKSPRASGFQT